MIVPMKKLYLLCVQEEQDKALARLGKLGVVHITADADREDTEDEGRSRMALDDTKRALSIISANAGKNSETGSLLLTSALAESGSALVAQAIKVDARIRELHDRMAACEAEKKEIAPFGTFEPESIEQLTAKGMHIKLLSLPIKGDYSDIAGVSIFELSQSTGKRFIMAVSQADFDVAGATEHDIPSRSLGAVLLEIESCKAEIAAAKIEISEMTRELPVVERYIKECEEGLTLSQARAAIGAGQSIAYLSGYCPADSEDALRSAAKDEGWGLVFSDPQEDDNPPTFLRYPKWVEPVKPLFGFLGISPGYRETDVSSAFYIFMSIFFAMIVGDAAYGAIILAIILWARLKAKDAPREPFLLMTVFSLSTIVWGVLTANYFGIPPEQLPAALTACQVKWLGEQNNSMTFCLLLGAIHLSLAHGWSAIGFGRSMKALAQVGWIAVTWSIFALSRMLLIEIPLPVWFMPAGIVGIIAIVTAACAKKEWLSFALLPQDLISNFGDLVSYLRLFALGIAGVQVARAFNYMAGMVGMDNPGTIALSITILFFGHTLNVILCAMSVLVHGVRLNALEFSLHKGLEWSGYKYRPFVVSHQPEIQTSASLE